MKNNFIMRGKVINMKINFFKKSLFLLLALLILIPNHNIFAAESNQNNNTNDNAIEEEIVDINNQFENILNKSTNLNVNTITTDEEAYSVLLDNIKYITFNSDKTLNVNFNKIALNLDLSNSEINTLLDFVNRINSLIILKAITIDKTLLISFVTDLGEDYGIRPRAAIIEIMGTTRKNAKTLKNVFDDAVFSTRHAVAGAYFAQRVKPGGVWDFKVQLGTKTSYTVGDLSNSLMTGEAIGNFHYGYVGRAIFSATTLKSAAGLVQIGVGNSSLAFYDSFFDDPKDQTQIQRGIDKYNAEH